MTLYNTDLLEWAMEVGIYSRKLVGYRFPLLMFQSIDLSIQINLLSGDVMCTWDYQKISGGGGGGWVGGGVWRLEPGYDWGLGEVG